MQEEEKGKDCGSLQTLFLKVHETTKIICPTPEQTLFLGSFFYFYQKLDGAGQFFFLSAPHLQPSSETFFIPQSHLLRRKIMSYTFTSFYHQKSSFIIISISAF